MNVKNNSEQMLVAYCGLYCGNCSKYKKNKCPGCILNDKMTWCKIRSCCIENNFTNCSQCKTFSNVKECKDYNNFIGKVIEFFFRSDRSKCIEVIKSDGLDKFISEMQQTGKMSYSKRQSG